jgi:glucose-6-phosphate isomerase
MRRFRCERSVFTQGLIRGFDCVDQWGGKLDKVLADKTAAKLLGSDDTTTPHERSTNALKLRYRQLRWRCWQLD